MDAETTDKLRLTILIIVSSIAGGTFTNMFTAKIDPVKHRALSWILAIVFLVVFAMGQMMLTMKINPSIDSQYLLAMMSMTSLFLSWWVFRKRVDAVVAKAQEQAQSIIADAQAKAQAQVSDHLAEMDANQTKLSSNMDTLRINNERFVADLGTNTDKIITDLGTNNEKLEATRKHLAELLGVMEKRLADTVSKSASERQGAAVLTPRGNYDVEGIGVVQAVKIQPRQKGENIYDCVCYVDLLSLTLNAEVSPMELLLTAKDGRQEIASLKTANIGTGPRVVVYRGTTTREVLSSLVQGEGTNTYCVVEVRVPTGQVMKDHNKANVKLDFEMTTANRVREFTVPIDL